MSIVRKIVGWVRGLGKGFIFLRKIPTERVSWPVVAVPEGQRVAYRAQYANPVSSAHGKAMELALIASRITQLDKSIAQAKRNGKRQSDFKAERNRLCNRRSVLEAGQ